MDVEELKEKLKSEGFPHIYEWEDGPGTEYPAHVHKGEVAMYIVSGSLTFWFGNEEVTLRQGDHFSVSVAQEHTAKVGPTGCRYVVGEMIEEGS